MICTENYIYVAIPKTASTSIESCLQPQYPASRHQKLNTIDHRNKFTFTFMRNPFDWLVSYFPNCNPQAFKKQVMAKPLDTQYSYFKPGVDFLGHFETLQEDWDKIKHKLNTKTKLPHLNKSIRCETDYYYDNELRDFVREQYKEDFKVGNYG